MPWTTPKTDFSPGNVLTAAQMNAIGENLNAIGGAWTSYTPTWTGLTVGNATQDSRYIKAGRLVVMQMKLTFGSTTSVTGTPEFTVPVALDGSYTAFSPVGNAHYLDSSADNGFFSNLVPNVGLTGVRCFVTLTSGTHAQAQNVSSIVPFTWAVSDVMQGLLVYEAAS